MPGFPLDPFVTLVLVGVFTAIAVHAWMRAARITDDQDEKSAERLQMSMRAFRFPPREEL